MAEVQGKSASAEEGRVAISLDKLKHDYIFQFQVFNITGDKGSFVLDLLQLPTVPFTNTLE